VEICDDPAAFFLSTTILVSWEIIFQIAMNDHWNWGTLQDIWLIHSNAHESQCSLGAESQDSINTFFERILHRLCVLVTISSLEFPLICYGKFLLYILVGPVCRVGREKKSSHNVSARTELSLEVMGVVIRLYWSLPNILMIG
jgi:hypothetical protein